MSDSIDDGDVVTPPAVDPRDTEIALLRAGVDLDSPTGKILARSWEGRTPDAEAIKAEWASLQPPPPPAPPAEPDLADTIVGDEADQAQTRGALASGGVAPGAIEVDPMDASLAEGFSVLHPPEGSRQKAGTHEDALATGFHVRAVAASKGDSRVLVEDYRG